jgi:hypothetical protein
VQHRLREDRIAPISVHVRDSQHAAMLFEVILDKDWTLLWTQLRHLSHMDRKTKAKSGRKSRCKGGYRAFRRPGRSTPHPSHTSLPTIRNLAGMPRGVNHLGKLGGANWLDSWLPGVGTFGARYADLNGSAAKRRLCVSPTNRVSQQSFYSRRHRHRRVHRERFIEPSPFDVRACMPLGPVP